MTPEDALFGFVAWITTRTEVARFGATEDCSSAVELLEQFLIANGLGDVSDDYPGSFSMPKEMP